MRTSAAHNAFGDCFCFFSACIDYERSKLVATTESGSVPVTSNDKFESAKSSFNKVLHRISNHMVSQVH